MKTIIPVLFQNLHKSYDAAVTKIKQEKLTKPSAFQTDNIYISQHSVLILKLESKIKTLSKG